MRIHRFIGDFDFKDKKFFEISDRDLFHQVKDVLRMRPGHCLILSDGKLNEALIEVLSFKKNSFKVKILEERKNDKEPERDVILYCSILKKQNFELVVQKATEIGIKEITPIVSQRVVKTNLRFDRLNKIIKEAAEQSGRGLLTKLNKILNFQEAVKEASKNNDLNILFDQKGEEIKGEISRVENKKARRIGVFIGPEGGWSQEEIQLVKDKKFKILSLGKLTFRSETAAIVASYLGVYFIVP
jgi:16S rRNA (uracil1498-N3)-methyltransferase